MKFVTILRYSVHALAQGLGYVFNKLSLALEYISKGLYWLSDKAKPKVETSEP